ncbi:MAG: hypothetical protein RJB39_290 [Candidatus Parcubacteria bacterium]|jgi:type II secretory pathway pseudopilin PulG
MRRNIFKRGISLIEVIIGVAIISLSTIYISQAYGGFVAASADNVARVQATFLLDEGVEAVKTLRGESWTKVASTTVGVPYYLIWNTDRWAATTTPQVTDGRFYRTMIFSTVNRDASFNISTTTGTLDNGTRKVDLAVAWNEKGSTSTRSISMYVFNIFN